MQWLIVLAASLAAMVVCMLVFALKVHRTGKLHGCGHSGDCHCHGDSANTFTRQGRHIGGDQSTKCGGCEAGGLNLRT